MIYDFVNKQLLTLALTHSSASKDNNERLEFIGDGLVNLIIADYLFKTFPDAQEGQLSRMRASLVKGEALAVLAQSLKLSDSIIVGPGEMRIAGQYRESILAGVMEAMIGAIYLDSNFERCQQVVLAWYKPMLANLNISQSHIDAKTQLQEMMQARRLPLPHYVLIEQTPSKIFHIECRLEMLEEITRAQAENRKKAEQIAAKLMIEKIQNE